MGETTIQIPCVCGGVITNRHGCANWIPGHLGVLHPLSPVRLAQSDPPEPVPVGPE